MRRFFSALIKTTNVITGYFCGILFLLMGLTTIINVVMRYGFSSGLLWMQDLSIYCFGIFAVLTIPYTYFRNRHVRVDIFKEKQTRHIQKLILRFSILAIVLPLFLMVLALSLPDVIYSISIGESSPQIGGLDYYFLVKSALPIFAVLMVLNGLFQLWTSFYSSAASQQGNS